MSQFKRNKLRQMMGKTADKSTVQPALPPVDDPDFNQAVKEMLEQTTGKRGDKKDAMVTFRDLENSQLAKNLVERGVSAGAKTEIGVDGEKATGGFDSRDDGMPRPTYPPSAEDIKASAAYTRIIVDWVIPRLGNYAYSEVYRSITDSLDDAVLIGSTRSGIYVDVVGGGFTGFYWIRIVNTLGNRSEFAGGDSATTPLDFDVIRDAATSRAWQKNHSYSIYNAVIPTTGVTYIDDEAVVFIAQSGGISGNTEPKWKNISKFGQALTDNGITWKAVEAGKIPFMIDAETGLTVIEGAAIRKASIDALTVRDGFFDRMTAAKGTLGEANIAVANIFDAIIGGAIRSKNFERGKFGFEIKNNGNAEFNDVTMRGVLTNGTINPNTGRVTNGQYIDFRRGVYDEFHKETQGNFILGDISSDNYISFKYEPEAGQRILRVRGDIITKVLYPGDKLYLKNDTKRSINGTDGFYWDIPSAVLANGVSGSGNSNVSPHLNYDVSFRLDNAKPNFVSYPSWGVAGAVIPVLNLNDMLDEYVTMDSSNIVIAKENFVYGTGKVTLHVVGTVFFKIK